MAHLEFRTHMNLFARAIRAFAKLRFRLLNLATIKDIPRDKFELLLNQLRERGWRVYSKYQGFDAGIDYDCLHMRKGFKTLKCEWDNWSEWSVEGGRRVVQEIAELGGLPVTYAWRWSEYDA
jgi:hypothetical protein